MSSPRRTVMASPRRNSGPRHKSVFAELEELKRLLDFPESSLDGVATAINTPDTGTIKTYSTALNSAEKNVDRLGRAIEAAEEEMEAALRRTTDVHKVQLKQKDLEIMELQRVMASKERAIDDLRDSLASTQRAYDTRLGQADTLVAAKDAEIAALQADNAAVREERDNIETRMQRALSEQRRVDYELREKEQQLQNKVQLNQDDLAKLSALHQRDTKEKKTLKLEADGLKREVEILREALQRKHDECAGLQGQVSALQSELNRLTDANKDLVRQQERVSTDTRAEQLNREAEVAELRRRLRVERSVRKACERWLRAELKSREDMEAILVAIRDMARAQPCPSTTELREVEALIETMKVLPANDDCRAEFAATRRQLEEDSSILRAELVAARKLLSDRLQDR